VETLSRDGNCLLQGFLHLTLHSIICGCVLRVVGLAARWQLIVKNKLPLLIVCIFSEVVI
jgi:hypothetical protein